MDMTNVNIFATDGFTECVGAPVYYIDSEDEGCETYPDHLHFERNIIGGRGVMCSVLTPATGNNQGAGGVDFGEIYDISCRSSSASSMARPATSWT